MSALVADPRVPAPDLAGPSVSTRVSGPAVPADVAWSFLGDTDWYNRSVGNGVVVGMNMGLAGDGVPSVDGSLTGPAGVRLPFHETWMSWEKGRFFRQVRQVESPILRGTDWVGWTEPEAGGKVRPHVQLTLYGPIWMQPVLKGAVSRIGERTAAALEGLGRPAPPARELSDAAPFAAWRKEADGPLVDRIVEHLRHARPTDIARMRPFALADRWGVDREALLEAFVLGVSARAVELYWAVRCRRCFGAVGGGGSLSDVADHIDCPSCHIRTDTDLGENVEVVFAPHPSVLVHPEERYCTFYPAGAPEQHSVWTLGPGQRLETEAELGPGEWRLGAAGRGVDRAVHLREDGPSTALSWAATGPAEELDARAGKVAVRLDNGAQQRQRVYLTRMGSEEPRVSAALLTNRPAFRRRFGHQVLARDVRVSVRSVTLLFTDLSGSTAMYEELGDAEAFALVRDHFALLRAAIEREHGVVVKTIGDAVMASFHEPLGAARAALAMSEAFATWSTTRRLARPLSLKVGVHTGPALAVHSDTSGLDWFGGTVNLAARAQGAAGPGEIVFTEAMYGSPGVASILAERGRGAEPEERDLKGLGPTRLWRARGGGEPAPTTRPTADGRAAPAAPATTR